MRTFLTALTDRRGPVLRWEGPDGASLELTGPVLANWVHKAHGLLADSDVGPDLDLGIVDTAGLHWRALAGALAAWGHGACVRIITDEEPTSAWTALASEHRAQDPVTHSADEVLIFPVAPLSLGVDAPPDTIDFATALRAYPDESAVGAITHVAFGDATATATESFHALIGPPAGAASPDSSTPGTDAVLTTATETGGTAPTTPAEVVVTAAPLSTADWDRVTHGLLHGVVVFRQVDP